MLSLMGTSSASLMLVLQAKTIEEIHAEAHAELGMMPATIIPALESLAALPRQTATEVELFPSFKGGMCFLCQCL